MARPNTTTRGRVKPVGDAREGRGGIGGLSFTRVPGVRRIRNAPADPRTVLQMPTAEDNFEARYARWYNVWGGTRPEFVVFDYLTRVRKYIHGVDFAFQSSFQGGRQRLGGSVVDFEMYRERVFIRVQGERFHSAPANVARDAVQKASLLRTGFAVVDVWAIPVVQAPRRVIEAALRGITLRTGITA